MANDRPIVYVDNGITYYRASSLLQCPRAFVYARQGHPPRVPKSLQVAFDYGNEHEDDVIAMLEARGYSIIDRQREVILEIAPTVHIIGHIDGVVYLNRSLVEIKCLNHENTEQFLNVFSSFQSYITQVSAYALAFSDEIDSVLFAIYDKDDKQLHLRTIPISDLYSLDHLTLRVLYLEQLYRDYQSDDILPTCVPTTYCPYYYLHEDELVDDPDLERELTTFQIIKSKVEAYERLKGLVQTRIKSRLSTSDIPKGRVGRFKYSYSAYKSHRLDTRRASVYLKSIDHYDEFVNMKDETRLVVEEVDE